MTTAIFNENQFLASVKRMNTIVPFRGGERNAKDFIAHTLRRCGYNTSDAFHYFKSFIDEYVPEVKNKRFDVAGWKKIYTHYIEKRPLSKFTKHLKMGLSMAETEDDFEYCFTAAANSAGYKGDLLLFEIRLDSIGWENIVKTLVQVADEKGIEVPALPVVKKKSRGRKKKETSIKVKTAPVKKKMGTAPAAPVIEEKKLDTSHKSVKGIVVAYYTDKDKRIDRSLPPIGTYNSQQEAADKLGMSKATISNYFRGVKSSVRWTRDDGVKFWIGLERCAA